MLDHKISHDFPYAYLASDAFLHAYTAQYLKDSGSMMHYPMSMSGGFEDSINIQPPLFNQIVAFISEFSGIGVHDIMYLFVFLFTLFSIFIIYQLLSEFNTNLAILSLPLSLLLFSGKFFTGYTWGQWDFYAGTFFLLASVWALKNLYLKRSYLLLAIFISSAFLAHTVEGIWAAGFIGFYMIYLIARKKLDLSFIKKISASAAITIALTSYYLWLFINFWIPNRSGSLFKITSFPEKFGYNAVQFADFGILSFFVIAGLLVAAFYLYKKQNKILLFSVFMFLMGFTYIIGFDKAIQMRLLWPLHLSILFGLGIYQLSKLLFKKVKVMHSILISSVLIIIFVSIFYTPVSSQGIMDPYRWEQLNWIKQNTPEDANIYYFYGDPYSQNSIFHISQRASYYVTPDDYISALKNKTIRKEYLTRLTGLRNTGLPYSKGFLSYGLYVEDIEEDYFMKKRDICNFDYYVFDKLSGSAPALAQYNLMIRQKFIESGMQEVFSNQLLSVLRNDDVGGDCIE